MKSGFVKIEKELWVKHWCEIIACGYKLVWYADDGPYMNFSDFEEFFDGYSEERDAS